MRFELRILIGAIIFGVCSIGIVHCHYVKECLAFLGMLFLVRFIPWLICPDADTGQNTTDADLDADLESLARIQATAERSLINWHQIPSRNCVRLMRF